MLPRLWLLVGSDQQTDRQTMSVIELSWTAKKLQLPSIKLDEPKSLYSTNTISEVWEKYTFPNFGAVPGSRQMLILQERNMIQGSKQIQTSLSPILVQLKQEKSSFSGFFSQFVMGSSENHANSENLIHTGGLQVPDIGWGCTKSGRI